MKHIEPSPIDQPLGPAQPNDMSTNQLIQRAAVDLTPRQAMRVSRKIARHRIKTIERLAKKADLTALTRADVIEQAVIKATDEQAQNRLHGLRMDCLAQAALKHEETGQLIDLVKDEVVHSLFKDALKGVSARYASGVIRRSGS